MQDAQDRARERHEAAMLMQQQQRAQQAERHCVTATRWLHGYYMATTWLCHVWPLHGCYSLVT